MQEAVSDILLARSRDTDGMSRMLMVSLAAHAVLIVGLVAAPDTWLSSHVEDSENVMMISIGGVAGPDAGGMTPIAGRAVQRVAEPEAKPRDVRPAPETPKMVEPTPAAKPAPRIKPVEKPAERSTSRTPTSGAEVKSGAAAANTGGAAVPFGGLSTTSGGGTGAAYTDYANFCCPSYLNTMVQLIQRNWNQNQGATGTVLMKFTVLRDGRIVNIEHEKPSNIFLLDTEAQRALAKTTLPALPREFPDDRLTVHLYFQYKR
jgi:TonB family protein